jgi:hypothetical protein
MLKSSSISGQRFPIGMISQFAALPLLTPSQGADTPAVYQRHDQFGRSKFDRTSAEIADLNFQSARAERPEVHRDGIADGR